MTDKSEIIPLRPSGSERLHAADWLAKLDRGNLTSDERRAFARWLAEDPRNKSALKDLADMWYGLNSPLSQLGADVRGNGRGIVRMRLVPAMVGAAFIRFRGLAVASVLAGSVVVAAALFATLQPRETFHTYATKIGETRTVSLEDGSTVYLNTNSVLQQTYSSSRRAVRLVSGEAIFEVAHNRNWPFLVYTNRGVIRAVGTKFAVRVERNKVVVEVTEGQVALEGNFSSAPGASARETASAGTTEAATKTLIGKDEAAEIGRAPEPTKAPVPDRELEDRLSWAQGQLVFHDKTLQSVVDEVSRYTSVHIEIADDELKARKVTGILQIGDLNQMLDGLKGALGIDAKWMSPGVVRLTRG